MAKITELTNALLDSANTVSNVYDNYLSNDAKRSTQNKQIQLKADINQQMMEIQRSSTSDQWETKINDYFQKVKGEMSNKNSPYYCKNNLQAEMFDSILQEAQVDVSNKVGQLVFNADKEKAIVDYRNNLTLLAQTEGGQEYINKANEMAKSLFDCGYISREQYQTQLDNNFNTAYINTATQAFNDSIDQALERGDSENKLIKMVLDNVTNLIGVDTEGLPKSFDKKAINSNLEKTLKQDYRAHLADMQQQNANKLAEINQQLNQTTSKQDRNLIARRGQLAMNNMPGLKLSEDDRNKYSALFKYYLDDDGTGSGSGSTGSGSKKPTDKLSTLLEASPDTGIELVANGDVDNYYDAVRTIKLRLTDAIFFGNYQENYDKDYNERKDLYEDIYEAKVSENALIDEVVKRLVEKYPSAKELVKDNYKNLINDIKKDPDKYGSATVGELSDFIIDTIMGSDANMTDDEFVDQFNKHLNDCYVEHCKYLTLDKKGELEKKYNANKASDIAKAARIAQEKDFVFTYNGQERWAPGKKEALEAEGGVIDVLKNAVAGTLGIPESEYGSISYYFKPDEKHDDLTSTPIIQYNNKSYEVIPDDDDKGFKLRDYFTGEIIEGTIPDRAGERKKKKKEENAKTIEAYKQYDTLMKQREEATNKLITDTKAMPTAMKAVGVIEKEDWEWAADLDTKKYNLNVVINKINNDVEKVKKNKMSEEEFKRKYNIDYSEWEKESGDQYRYELILRS